MTLRWMVALLAASVAASAGCRPSGSPQGTIVVALESMPQNLDPRFATDASSSRIGNLVFRSLTRVDRNQQHVPDLAIDWKLDGPRSVVFLLRKGVRFHDGTPLAAADVRATYESILAPGTASPKRQLLDFIESIETPDELSVRFRMKEPFAPFLQATGIGILPRRIAADPGASRIGSGPFRIAAVEASHEVRLEAVAGHTGAREIRFRVIPDETVRALEIRKSTVHLVQNGIEPENLVWLRKEAGLCVRQQPGTTFQYIGINLRDPALADLRVRRAIAHAIDRDSIVRHLLNGTARPATGLLSTTHWAYEPDVRTYPHDPAESRRLLDEAGLTDPDGEGPKGRLTLTYKTTTLASRRRIAEALQAMLAPVGIRLEIRSFDWGTFYDDIRRGNFQIYGLAWVGISDPDIYFNILASDRTPPRGDNRGFFANAEIDRLTSLGRRTFDPRERREIYGQVQKIAAEELPFIPMWWEDVVAAQDRRICGFVPYPNGDLVSLRTAWWVDDPPQPGARGPCGCDAGAGS